jgi:hypothetical protein
LDERVSHRYALTGFDQHLGNAARVRAGNFDRRFVRFQLDNSLVFVDPITFVDQDLQHVAGIYTIAQIGNFDFNAHDSSF